MTISRRDFIHAGCAAALVALAPARARLPHGGSSGVFNNGKTQVNLNFLPSSGDYPFLNCLKTAQSWADGNTSTNYVLTPDMLDANGYPTTFVNTLGQTLGGVYTIFFIPTQADRSGNYMITWSGVGTVTLGGATVFSGSLSTSGVIVTPTGSRISLGIATVGITNLQFFHVNDHAAVLAGQIFGVKFKAQLAAANFGVIRFLNWQSGNTTNVTTWATRKPQGYAWYGYPEYRSTLYCSTPTSLTGTKFSATGPSGFSFADKATIHVLFAQSYSSSAVTFTNGSASILKTAHGLAVNARISFTNDPNNASTIPTNFTVNTKYYVVSVPDANHITVSATQGGTAIIAGSAQVGLIYGDPFLTINISGSGDIDILSEYSLYLSFGGNSYPIGGNSDSLATLVYDADLNAWIKQGGDVAIGSCGIDNGVPPELMVELCKEVGAHPYFISPPLAVTPMTDYHTQLATYCLANAPSWMIPRFEGPNELWNTAGGFYQTEYAQAKATAYSVADPTHWTANDIHNWYGKAISTIGQAVNSIYGGTPGTQTKYQVLCGVQTGTGASGGAAGSNPRLSSASYITQTASPQSGYTASAASGWVTHVCCAQYIGPSDQGTGAETTLAAAFAGKAFVASVASGVMNVTALNASNSAPFAVGDTIFDTQIFAVQNIPSGVTITSFGTATGGLGTYNISNSSISLASQNMTAATTLTAPNTYADTTNSGSGTFTVSACLTLYTAWKAWAQGFGIQKMCGYEGGYSPDYTSGGNSLVDMMKSASKLDTNLSSFTTTNYSNFVGLTGGGFTAEFPSCFQFSGDPNLFGHSTDVWSVLEDIYQTPTPPQWNAIVAFNN